MGALLLAGALACAAAARAQAMPEAGAQLDEDGRWANGVTESWWPGEGVTAADTAGAAARWKAIGDELAGAGRGAWGGDYFRGSETHGTYLRWSPGAGFVIADVDKCRAAVMALAYGRAEATPRLVQFYPEFHKEAPRAGHRGHGAQAAPPRAVLKFVPVEWRGERLLVAEEGMGDFGDYAAGLGRYNEWNALSGPGYLPFFYRSGAAGDGGGGGGPVVPPGYERFLKKPVEAAVTSVGRRAVRRGHTLKTGHTFQTFARASLTYVTVDAGTERGVKNGMVFRVLRGDEEEEESLVVVRAGRRASTGVVVRDLDERGAETYYSHAESREKRRAKVAAGWRLTTSPRH